jgi:acyl-CoA thioesterase FadM
MPSNRIVLPDSFPFATRISVRITDINYGQHLGNDALVSLLHEARVRFLAHYGFSEKDAGGPGLIMRNLEVAFSAEVRYGAALRIEVAGTRPGRAGFDVVYRVWEERPDEDIAVAVARTGMAFFDYEAGKVSRMPEAFRPVFSEEEAVS